MKRSSIIALTLAFGVFYGVRASAAQFGRDADRRDGRVCFFQDANYIGWQDCYNVGDEVTSMGGHNSNASSIRIYGRVRVTVWAETGFRGASTEFTSDVPQLSLRAAPEGHTWNDRIRSLRVVAEFDRPSPPPVAVAPPPPPPPAPAVRSGICVYEHARYQGREECWLPGDEVGNIRRRSAVGDRISSIRVFGNAVAVVYRDTDFRGERLFIDRDIPDLDRVRIEGVLRTWNDQISSLQVDEDRGRGRGRGRR